MVAHVQKFKKDDVRGLEIHFERSSENLSNKDIDHERSRENYDLLANGTPIRSRVKELVESRDNPTQTALHDRTRLRLGGKPSLFGLCFSAFRKEGEALALFSQNSLNIFS